MSGVYRFTQVDVFTERAEVVQGFITADIDALARRAEAAGGTLAEPSRAEPSRSDPIRSVASSRIGSVERSCSIRKGM